MDDASKPRTPERIDTMVSAELPDPATNPKLFEFVKSHMIHGPCGKVNEKCPCMAREGIDKKCTKDFPKAESVRTHIPQDSFPNYRRRSPDSGGMSLKKRFPSRQLLGCSIQSISSAQI